MNDPLTQKGSLLTIFNPNKEEFIVLPPEQHRGWRNIEHKVDALPPGTYRFRIRVGSVKGSVKSRHFLELGAVPNEGQFNLLRTLQVTGSTDNPQVLEVDIQLSLNGPRKFALREKATLKTMCCITTKALMKRVSPLLPLFGLIGSNGKVHSSD